MHEILSMSDRKIAPNRSRCSVLRVGCPHEASHDLPRVLDAFHDGQQRGTLCNELDEFVVIGLTLVLGVVALGCQAVDCAELGRDDAQLLVFQATKNFADETALDAVGLHDEERSIHDEAI